MDISDLSIAEQESLPRVLAYWVSHWDWECPVLFGLEMSDFQSTVESWPLTLVENERVTALALVGAWRELLYGGSAVGPDQVPRIAGITYEEATELLKRLLPRIDHALR